LKRTAIQTSLKGQDAIQAAIEAAGWERAPGAEPARKRYADSDTDLREMAAEMFAGDELRDDDDLSQADADALLSGLDDDARGDAIAEAQELVGSRIKGKVVDGWREQQGGIVATHKGRIARWVLKPAHGLGGKLASTQDVAAVKQRARYAGLDYAARVERRIDAVGASLFQGTGGLTDNRKRLLIEGFKADRLRRGWRVPDL
jgi:hypothetical protein